MPISQLIGSATIYKINVGHESTSSRRVKSRRRGSNNQWYIPWKGWILCQKYTQMHYVKLSPDKVVRVYHGNVKRFTLVAAHSEQEVKEVVVPVTVGNKDFRSNVKQLTLVEAMNLMLDIKVEALKEGDEVIIIGGTQCGREGILVGSTSKNPIR